VLSGTWHNLPHGQPSGDKAYLAASRSGLLPPHAFSPASRQLFNRFLPPRAKLAHGIAKSPIGLAWIHSVLLVAPDISFDYAAAFALVNACPEKRLSNLAAIFRIAREAMLHTPGCVVPGARTDESNGGETSNAQPFVIIGSGCSGLTAAIYAVARISAARSGRA